MGCLEAGGVLTLVVDTNKVLLVDLLDFHEGRYCLDGAMVRRMMNTATTADNRYTPREVNREAKKLATQSMYKG